MNIVCCGIEKDTLDFLCIKPFCKIYERRKDCNGLIYYLVHVDLDKYLSWLNRISGEGFVIFTTPEIWINRKKVSLTIKYNSCCIHFFEITYENIKGKIKGDIII